MPALPLDEAGKYVAAAYIVFLSLILIYVAIMATKLRRIETLIDELTEGPETTKGSENETVGDRASR